MSFQGKTIHLTYYAFLREVRGVSQETIQTAASTAQDLYRELQEKHGFNLSKDSLKVAVNDSFSFWEVELKEGDHIVFIPPVSGG